MVGLLLHAVPILVNKNKVLAKRGVVHILGIGLQRDLSKFSMENIEVSCHPFGHKKEIPFFVKK